MTTTRVCHTAEDLAGVIGAWKDTGETIALVPTMGALHDGHLALVERACQLAQRVVVSIFVNPLQFGLGEDFDRYPREVSRDVEKLSGYDVDVVFVPGVEVIYPDWPDTTPTHFAGPVGDVFEGVSRPGHFDGVLTAVSRLFDLVACDVAVFGQKDAQQVFVVSAMAKNRHPAVTIDVVDTVREPSGLALSSRNSYLDEAGAQRARFVGRAAAAVADAVSSKADGGISAQWLEQLLAATRASLPEEVSCDYLDVVDRSTFSPWRGEATADLVVIIACLVESVRLIDAVAVSRLSHRDD